MRFKLLNVFVWGAYAYFSVLLLQITLQYIPYNTDVAFLRIKQDVIRLWYYELAFFVHVYTSVFLLVLGAIQMIPNLVYKYKKLHWWSGRLYAFLIIFVSGPCGLVMAYYANGGWISQLAFVILSVLWISFTSLSVYHAMKGNIMLHRNFAIRRFALTCSAISLRLFKYIIIQLFEPQAMDAYRIVAWLGWIVNLLIVEYIIYRKSNLKSKSSVF